MNIAFYLTLKNQVVYVLEDATIRQVAEKMEHHRYTAIPVLNQAGHYVGTITEGDLLRALRHFEEVDRKELEKRSIRELEMTKNYRPVRIDARMEDLFDGVIHQNFVPVIDDQGIFIGIVRRSDIIANFQQYIREED